MSECVLYATSRLVQVFSAIAIGRYDPSHSSKPILCPTWSDNVHWTASWQSCQQLKVGRLLSYISSLSADDEQQSYPSVLISFAWDDPSPAAFQGALAMFTLAALYLHTFHREFRYENRCLIAAVLAAAVMSSARCFILFDKPLTKSIQICLPASLMVGSVVSDIIHRTRDSIASKEQGPTWKQRKKTLSDGRGRGEKQGL